MAGLDAARQESEAAQVELERAMASVEEAAAEHAELATTQAATALDELLRERHASVTGRDMPCRVPRVLRRAMSFVRSHPDEV